MDAESHSTPLKRAVATAGSQTAFAKMLGVGQAAVSKWLAKDELPPKHVLRVERETGVPKEELRPDIYPPELAAAATPAADRLEGVRQ